MRPYKTITNCKVCYGPLSQFIDLGETPLADAFVVEGQEERVYPLRVAVCMGCKLVQLLDNVDKELLFNDDYAFFTGASPSSIQYFKDYAQSVLNEYPSDGLHVEIASNDGTLLKHFIDAGKPCLGVDPAGNTVQQAIASGVPSIVAHFDKETAMHIVESEGKASVIMANNVVAHVDDLHSFMEGIAHLLTDDGVFIAEVQYFPHLLFNNAFDHIYHEHRSFFSFHPIQNLFALHGLTIVDVKEADAQGGSIRVFAKRNPHGFINQRVYDVLNYEKKVGILDFTTYQGVQQHIDFIKLTLLSLLRKLKDDGRIVHGFGASAKGNTLLNYCGIGPDLVSAIADLTPYKMNKLTPGTHIPVDHPDNLVKPDYYLLQVWNYLPGVLERNKDFLNAGGHFILPIPTPLVI